MLRNYFKVALRYLSSHKGYTIINVSGLAVGIACCILIMLFVRSEWSFDRFHSKADRIHRAWLEEHYEGQIFTNTVTPVPLAPVLQNNLPEVETTCRIFSFSPLVRYNNNVFTEPVNMVDSTFFNLFDFALTAGDRKIPLATGNSIVITETAAKKYFGNKPATGKNIEVQISREWVPFTVAGVVKDAPLESSIQFQMLISFANGRRFFSEKAMTQAWSSVSVESYVLLKEGVSASTINAKIPAVMNPLVAKNYKPGEYKITLQPLTDIHLNNTLPAANQPVSNPKFSIIMATIGILVLLIACINFVTLSIGRSTTRSLEVGVRKVLGAERLQLIRQFWGEALLLTFISFLLAVILAFVCLKPFNQLADRELVLSMDGFTMLFFFVLFLAIGLIAGVYPAIVLSGFRPIEVLKGKMSAVGSMGLFRRALVVGQFVASIIMIISTITIGKQLSLLRNKDLGYNKEHVVVIPTNKQGTEGRELAAKFTTAINANTQIRGSTTSWFSLVENGWMTLGYKDDKGAFRQFRMNLVDPDFIPTMGLKIIAGRNFDGKNIADSNAIIVNEALVKEYGWKDPIGKRLPGKYAEEIIGVVQDFHFESLHTPVKPVMLAIRADSIVRASSDITSQFSTNRRVTVRLSEGDITTQIAFLKSTWKAVAGDQDFDFSFLDEALNASYKQEIRLGNIVRYASFLSIFIACLGLFGLATLVVNKRTKEIGIRKVLGANAGNIVGLLSKEFVLLVVIAALLSFPIAWYGLHKWLQDFSYRVSISWWIFFVAAVAVLIIALFTVSFQAIRAALTNPVKSLRSE
jgi:putative ABC transport system permease protein